jgi:hypothetical protein
VWPSIVTLLEERAVEGMRILMSTLAGKMIGLNDRE